MSFVLDGIKVGSILAVLLGPAFFAMTQKTIERGTIAGILVGVGVWVSDFLYITASFYAIDFLQTLNKSSAFEFWMGIVGCFFLVVFGFVSFINATRPIKPYKSNNFLPILEGFSINTLNPFNIFFWLSVTTSLMVRTQNFEVDALYFYLGVFITVVLTDLLKVLFARQLKLILTAKYIILMKRFSGIALIIFGLIVLFKSQHWWGL